jgi:hypothetical protein
MPRSAKYDGRAANVCWGLRLIVVFDGVRAEGSKSPIWYIFQIGSSSIVFVLIKLLVVK